MSDVQDLVNEAFVIFNDFMQKCLSHNIAIKNQFEILKCGPRITFHCENIELKNDKCWPVKSFSTVLCSKKDLTLWTATLNCILMNLETITCNE